MLIKEVILENFMSYEYARVPLSPGVNVVCGPNGAGKSSFLLGICVALGESYTERSRRLSDLIRWDQDLARVTLLLDNTPREDGKRPAPQFDTDTIRLTRSLRRDGKYWFELNNRGVQKYEVMNLLSKFGFDPENMLVIMHQNIPEQFAALSPQEKLRMLERAVGFESFRADVLEARRRLSGILSEEESLNQLIERAKETLGYWREQYEKLQEKRRLQMRSTFLQRELAWSRVAEIEASINRVQKEIEEVDGELFRIERDLESLASSILASQRRLSELRGTWLNILEQRIDLERTSAVCEYALNMAKERAVEAGRMKRALEEEAKRLEGRIKELLSAITESNPSIPSLLQRLSGLREELAKRLERVEQQISEVVEEMEQVQAEMDEVNVTYIDSRIRAALLKAERERLNRRLGELKEVLDRERRRLSDAEAEASIRGPRVDTGRSADEILAEIRRVGGQLLAMANVTEEAEEMYRSYSSLFSELQERIKQVRESRRKVMGEIEVRTRKWWEVVRDLLDQVNSRYQSLLERLQATGEVRVVNPRDIEEAGLEIAVGFKGARQMTLDAYIHSGGERSTAIMAFLLALQQNILSPFRAIDEFDVHMDPKNREIVSDFIVSSMESSDAQYLVITPSQIPFMGKAVHIILVHKVGGVSRVSVVE
ncbi:AAA family ATPase [Candidatus Bathyarchaeota archaeon]|nr:AAA family ATPase [Candidatus Bathyarchaeota archaeon]